MKTLLAALLLSIAAQAQLTTISQFVANADGSPFQGEVTIQVPPFASRSYAVRSRDIWLCSSNNVITGCAQQIVDGVLTVQVLPNGGGSPSGTSYYVSYYPDVPPGRRPSVKTEYWVVPTGGPYTIDQVKTSTPPVPTVQISPTQLNPTGYTTGQFPCVVGGTFLPCSPTAAATWGNITGTLSNQADLQAALNAKAAAANAVLFANTPPGTCTYGTSNMYYTSGGALYGCKNGGWVLINYQYQFLAPSTLEMSTYNGTQTIVLGDDSVTNDGVEGLCAKTSTNGNITASDCMQVPNADTVSTLGFCSFSNQRQIKYVTNASAPTFLGTVTGGGTTKTWVFCNGTNWVAF